MTEEKDISCILCPNGCNIKVKYLDDEIIEIEGALCPKGNDYAKQEIKNPMRTLTSSVMVEGGDTSLVSVKTDKPVPLEKVMDIMNVIDDLRVNAPVSVGDIILDSPAGLDCSIVATREVKIKN
ncbi:MULTISPECIES: DUF1667 domain-containing protein [unclassified Halanaerobium]|uniref:DUF1667 domain-containing protein n=1 Tax=unclassified Halanaerobium TaxID=2641197 RepID=UPI000DF26AC0|nr:MULTISPECIES: DUF1667 domain-containing protein [unclassified Halanaerobium]RCW50582.1 CxxC motif-containing protein [Halanaerobium sp. MA284_MarDTE_T2]RCW82150.1 CxxC motif-containing protein [Halanaerobium sp. DL-01]